MGDLGELLDRLREQRQEGTEVLQTIEQELGSRTLPLGRRQALERSRGRLLHSQQLLDGLIEDLSGKLRRLTE